MEDIYEIIKNLEARIAELPKGYISKKNSRSKPQYYLQWKENGKIKSKYVNEADLETTEQQIEERKRLQEKVRELKKLVPDHKNGISEYETRVVFGSELKKLTAGVIGFRKRDAFARLQKCVHGSEVNRVYILYGLRRTGKTTLLFQSINEMSDEDFSKTAYIKMKPDNTMDQLNRDISRLEKQGFQYLYIDEVTLMKDFIDTAAVLSDIYAAMGVKIILSGTDSLGFWFARDNELYDRERMIHTTYIPYREYSRVLGIDSIDEYIRYGGTLKQGENVFDDEDARLDDAAFRDDESTRRYVDTAIAHNIQHSLELFEDGRHFYRLYPLYEKGELTSAINRVVEDINHRFLLRTLTRDFESSDLGISRNNLMKERDPSKRTDVLSLIDKKQVTGKLMELLDIRNRENQSIGLTDDLVQMIKQYLKALDLIVECPFYIAGSYQKQEHILFAQPGMRYCQAQALVYSLMQDDVFTALGSQSQQYVTERILEEVRGRMLEEITLLDTIKSLPKRYEVFKLAFENGGEFDMVIRDSESDICAVYEIKHSSQCVEEQAKNLLDDEKLALTAPHYGELVGKYVLYLGEDRDTEYGVAYRNAEQFLRSLPQLELESGLEETVSGTGFSYDGLIL